VNLELLAFVDPASKAQLFWAIDVEMKLGWSGVFLLQNFLLGG
jgi:hypothetical protein